EVEFLRGLGLSVAFQDDDHKLGMPRVSASCDYLKPVRFQDVLEIAVTLRRLATKSVTYGFAFFKDGEVVARGQLRSGCGRVPPGRGREAVAIPGAVRERLERAACPTSRTCPPAWPRAWRGGRRSSVPDTPRTCGARRTSTAAGPGARAAPTCTTPASRCAA